MGRNHVMYLVETSYGHSYYIRFTDPPSMRALTSLLVLSYLALTALPAEGQVFDELLSTKDAIIGYHYGHGSAGTNYNSATWYGAMCQPGNLGGVNSSRGLIYFDLSAYAPGTIIDEANLDLYGNGPVGVGQAASVGHTGGNACQLKRITSNWQDYSVTWNSAPLVTNMNATPVASSSSVLQNYLGIDVTNLVQDMINNPSESFGFRLSLLNENPTAGLFFCGNSCADQTRRPRLFVKRAPAIGISEFDGPNSFTVFPNPASSGAHMTIPTLSGLGPQSAQLWDSMGQIVAEPVVLEGSFELPSSLPAGIYTLVVTTGAGRYPAVIRLSVIAS